MKQEDKETKKPKYEFKDVEYDWDKIEWRLKERKWSKRRFKTGIKTFDSLVGGLPYGLTVLVGEAGTGKSLMAKTIASKHESIYICSEQLEDAPRDKNGNYLKNVYPVNYTEFFPYQERGVRDPKDYRVVREFCGLISECEPDLVVIDSISSFCVTTTKAILEADIREILFTVARLVENKIPVIGISQIRRQGYWVYPAGGEGVSHAASLLVWFKKIQAYNQDKANIYGKKLGDTLWTIDVHKDKQAMATQNKECEIVYKNGFTNFDVSEIKRRKESKSKKRKFN